MAASSTARGRRGTHGYGDGRQISSSCPMAPVWRRRRSAASAVQRPHDRAGERGEEVGRMVRMVRRVLDEAGGEDAREFKEMVVELMTTAGLEPRRFLRSGRAMGG
ncbi:hypothetical protein ZWY2020_021589 [Hordeum vulgare]|nr:hypothetical protein ZWY2020_021589 [Hordeum vulgare]